MMNIEQLNGGYLSLTSAGLAGGTNAGTFKTASTLTFANNGVLGSKNATDNIALTAGHTALANSQACLFGVWIDGSGNFSTTQGAVVAAGDPCPVPAQNSGKTLVGLIKVSTSSSQTFTPGTSTLGTGNTVAYYNTLAMPGSAI